MCSIILYLYSIYRYVYMNRLQLQQTLKDWDKKEGRYVFRKHELVKLFPDDNAKAFSEAISRHVRDGLIIRACYGVYVNSDSVSFDRFTIEHIAIALRAGYYNYVSLESMLSEYGAISQIPIDRLTVMTTGRKGVYETPYGTIEFTHTKRSVLDILAQTGVISARPLRIATPETAWRDLKRVGRNIHLVEKRH